jgi:peptide deformylase
MAILKIVRMGHPILSRPAQPVPNPRAPEIHRLIKDMVETMEDADGAGLAAPQVHIPLQIVIFQAPVGRSDPGLDEAEAFERTCPLTVLINPEITVLDETLEGGWEGCLSVPGLRGWVERPAHIRYRGLTPEGEIIERVARGFHARVVQHECDHLAGRLYPSRMRDLSRLIFESEIRHFQQAP